MPREEMGIGQAEPLTHVPGTATASGACGRAAGAAAGTGPKQGSLCHPEAPESLAPGRSDRPKPALSACPGPPTPTPRPGQGDTDPPTRRAALGRGLGWPSDPCGAAGGAAHSSWAPWLPVSVPLSTPHLPPCAFPLQRGHTPWPSGPTALVSRWCSHPSSSRRPGPAGCGLVQPQLGRVGVGGQSLPPHVPLRGLLHPSLRDMLCASVLVGLRCQESGGRGGP